LMPKASAL